MEKVLLEKAKDNNVFALALNAVRERGGQMLLSELKEEVSDFFSLLTK